MSLALNEVVVLQYHRVSSRVVVGGTRVFPSQFRRHVSEVRRRGYGQLKPGRNLGGRRALFTFDDGFEDVREHALPALSDAGYTGAVFVVTDFIGREGSWDASFYFPGRHLSASHLRELAARSWLVGSHTRTHADLTRVDDARLVEELVGSKAALEDIVGAPVTAMSYPYGACDRRVTAAAREAGYRYAFTSRRALRTRLDTPLLISRSGVYITDFSVTPKLLSALNPLSYAVERLFGSPALLSSVARHRLPWLGRLAGARARV